MKANPMPQLQIKTVDMKANPMTEWVLTYFLFILQEQMQMSFFFFQNTDNAETLYVYRMLESILVKICRWIVLLILQRFSTYITSWSARAAQTIDVPAWDCTNYGKRCWKFWMLPTLCCSQKERRLLQCEECLCLYRIK